MNPPDEIKSPAVFGETAGQKEILNYPDTRTERREKSTSPFATCDGVRNSRPHRVAAILASDVLPAIKRAMTRKDRA